MKALLDFRNKLKELYIKLDVFVLAFLKLITAFVVLGSINSHMNYMSLFSNKALVLIAALACTFLPAGAITAFAAVFVLGHMYKLSLVALIFTAVLFVILFILFARLGKGYIVLVSLAPVFCAGGLGFVLPIILGLIATPVAAVPAGCGVVAYYVIETVLKNAESLKIAPTEKIVDRILTDLVFLIDGFIGNKAMITWFIVITITVIAVFVIRKLSIDYAWDIAIGGGLLVQIVFTAILNGILKTDVSVGGALLCGLLAAVIGVFLQLFCFCLDFNKTENVQFEDDEYYYYVKAVPKLGTKKIKEVAEVKTGTERVRRPSNTAERTVNRMVSNTASRTANNNETENNSETEKFFKKDKFTEKPVVRAGVKEAREEKGKSLKDELENELPPAFELKGVIYYLADDGAYYTQDGVPYTPDGVQ